MSHHYIAEFAGGLGDVLLRSYQENRYMTLANLPEGDTGTVFIRSVNPFSTEVFKWTPSGDRLKVVDVGWWHSPDDAELDRMRLEHGMPVPDQTNQVPKSIHPPVWYPSLGDLKVLEEFAGKNFFLIEPTAGTPDRTWPQEIMNRICATLEKHSALGVVIGRDYDNEIRNSPKTPKSNFILNLHNALSVPGTIRLMQMSKGAITSHSAIHHITCKENHPNFVLFPKSRMTEPLYRFDICMAADIEKYQSYWWGLKRPCCQHSLFEDFTESKLEDFIETNR